MLRDQRHMSGETVLATVEEVKASWQACADRRAERGLDRFPLAPRRNHLTPTTTRLAAHVNTGRWVAECEGGPTGECNGGVACWPEHEHGCCLDCGTVYPIDFPHDDEQQAAERVLSGRPEENRNWRPQDGETIEDLRCENIQHGYHPDGPQDRIDRIAAEVGLTRTMVERVIEKADE